MTKTQIVIHKDQRPKTKDSNGEKERELASTASTPHSTQQGAVCVRTHSCRYTEHVQKRKKR